MLDTLYLVGASFEGIAAHARESDSTIVDFFSNWIFLRGTLDTLPDAKAALIGTISVDDTHMRILDVRRYSATTTLMSKPPGITARRGFKVCS